MAKTMVGNLVDPTTTVRRGTGLMDDIGELRRFYSAGVPAAPAPSKTRPNIGRFIVLEGPDHEGNAGVAGFVAEMLCKTGLEVILSGEPGGSPGADAIARLLEASHGRAWGPTTELLLHAAQRLDHLQQTVIPALQEGVWVVCDGYVGRSIAHLGFGQGLGRDAVWRLHLQTPGGMMPVVTFLWSNERAVGAGDGAGDVPSGQADNRLDEGYRSLIGDPDISALALTITADRRETATRIMGVIERTLGIADQAHSRKTPGV